MKKTPILYIRKEECCGCTACYAICPKSAVYMVEDEEGFEYPQIEESKCVRCYQCINVCPIKVSKSYSPIVVYADAGTAPARTSDRTPTDFEPHFDGY